jgi:hypothetical protein
MYVQKNHPEELILGENNKGFQTRRQLIKSPEHAIFSFLSKIEPKNLKEANKDKSLVNLMN